MARKRGACNDAHHQALQKEITALRSYTGPGFQNLLQYSEFRRLAELVGQAHFRAVPAKTGSVAVGVNTVRGHSDGITTLGDHIVLPAYAVGQRPDANILKVALIKLARCADELDDLLDPFTPRPRDVRVRCGRSGCKGRNRRQPVDIEFCAYCGRSMREDDADRAN